MDYSQEVTEHLNPWWRILDEDQERHGVQLNAPSTLQKRTEKSTVWVSSVDPSDEERLHLPKSDGNAKKISKVQMDLTG